MTIEIVPGTEADFARCAHIQRVVFSAHPETREVNDMLFPGSTSTAVELEAASAKQLRDLIRGDPNIRFIKAVDTSLAGEESLVGYAKWHVYPEGFPGVYERHWGAGCNIEACKLFFGGMDEMQNRLMRGKPCMCLQPVMTATEHQRRGVGTKLIQWGLDLASSLDLPVFLIASPIGHSLYKKCGFRDMEGLTVDLSKYGVNEPHTTWAMIWEKDKQSS